MRHNLNALIKEEIVKRFESVVKEEIRRHNIAIESTNRDISLLKELFEDHKQKLVDILNESKESNEKSRQTYEKSKKELAENHSRQDKYLAEQGKEIQKKIYEFNIDKSNYIHIGMYDALKSRLANDIEMLKKALQRSEEKQKNTTYELYSKHRAILSEDLKILEDSIQNLSDLVEDIRNRLDTNIVDAQGISRMIKIDQKSMFIMEKKIENIYTLINRLNKRVDK